MSKVFSPLSNQVIGCAIEVHRELGPGLLENSYRQCLARELELKGIQYRSEHQMPVTYKGFELDCGYRVDLLVEEEIILELKCVQKVKEIHRAQLMTYMKLADVDNGFLINFNVELLKDGLESFVV